MKAIRGRLLLLLLLGAVTQAIPEAQGRKGPVCSTMRRSVPITRHEIAVHEERAFKSERRVRVGVHVLGNSYNGVGGSIFMEQGHTRKQVAGSRESWAFVRISRLDVH
jgi:hypothetical protein